MRKLFHILLSLSCLQVATPVFAITLNDCIKQPNKYYSAGTAVLMLGMQANEEILFMQKSIYVPNTAPVKHIYTAAILNDNKYQFASSRLGKQVTFQVCGLVDKDGRVFISDNKDVVFVLDNERLI